MAALLHPPPVLFFVIFFLFWSRSVSNHNHGESQGPLSLLFYGCSKTFRGNQCVMSHNRNVFFHSLSFVTALNFRLLIVLRPDDCISKMGQISMKTHNEKEKRQQIITSVQGHNDSSAHDALSCFLRMLHVYLRYHLNCAAHAKCCTGPTALIALWPLSVRVNPPSNAALLLLLLLLSGRSTKE